MPEPRVAAIVQARMGSSRLPGKVLRLAAGRTLLAHVVERVKAARAPHAIWIATSDRPEDDAIAAEAGRLGVPVFRGSEDDVLDRFRGAAEASAADVIVRITADCPLLDPAEVDRVAGAFLAAWPGLDYAANLAPDDRRIPLGLSVEVCSRAALERAWREGRERYHREHVMPYLYEAPGRFRTRVVHPAEDRRELRLTVDTPEDLEVVTAVLEAIDREPDRMSLAAAARFLDAHAEIRARNAGIAQRSFREASREASAAGPAPPLLLLRADAGAEAGLGHVMRCLALAEAWILEGGAAALLGAGLPERVAGWAAALGVACVALATDAARIVPGSADDARRTAAEAEARGARALVADGYAFGRDYLAALRSPALVTVFVDDLAQPDLPADLVLRPNAGAPGGEGILAGAGYILLREEIRRAASAPPRPRPASGRHLLLAFGGSDPARLSARALAAALAAGAPALARVTVLAGPLHPDRAALEAAASAAPIPVAVRTADPGEVAAILGEADLAVAAAGGTAWELAALGVPMLLAAVADNQRAVLEPLVASGAARRLGDAGAALEREIRAFVGADEDELAAMGRAGRALVDGGGARRAARAIAGIARRGAQGRRRR